MINVNQITAQLARMPDQTLQRYAQMHKSDPYILSLALAESTRRKQMRQGAQMSVPEQPKVADQAVAEMGAGVAALPAQNLQGMEQAMAAGGIVAFDEGGEVPRYADQGLVQLPGESFADFRRRKFQAELDAERAKRAQEPVLREAERQRRLAERGGVVIPPSPLVDRPPLPGVPPVIGSAAAAMPSVDADFPPAARTRAGPAPVANAPTARAALGPGTGGAPDAAASVPARDPLIENLLKPVTAAPVNFEPGQATFPTLEGIQNLFAANKVKPESVVDPLAAQREELTNLAAFQNAQERADLEQQIKKRGLLGEKQEARLKTREEKLGKQEKDLGPLALLQTGLAVMSGSSPYALQNIGTGAQLGLKGYKEGLEKLDAARERIEEGLDRIETARRSEGILNDQQRTALRREGNKIVTDGKRDAMNAWQQEFNISRSEANNLTKAGIDTLNAKAQSASAERLGAAQIEAANAREAMQQTAGGMRTAAQLVTQRDIANMEAAVKRGDQAVRMAEVRALAADKSVEAMRKVWAESKVLQMQYPNINDWLTMAGKGAAGGGAGTDYSKWGTPTKVGQ
jgi:hypothetical protein